MASGPSGARVASYTCTRRTRHGVCPAPATARIDAVDGYLWPEIERRTPERQDFAVYFETVGELDTSYERAHQELEDFLEGASITALGPDRYNREIARRRGTVEETRAAWQDAARQAEALLRLGASTSDVDHRRARARQAIESVTLARSTRGRWQPIEERLEVVWRA